MMMTIDEILDIDNCDIGTYLKSVPKTYDKDHYPVEWMDITYPISKNIYWSNIDIITRKNTIDNTPIDELFLIPKYMQYGDYDNSCMVERSNYKLFLEEYGEDEGVFTITGGYGSSGIAISLKWLLNQDNEERAQSVIDLLNGLNDYPCIDDEDVSNMEYEAFLESLDSFECRDALSELQKKFNITVYDHNEEKFKELLLEVDSNLPYPSYMIESGGSCYIDTKRLIEPISFEMLKPVLTDYETNDLPVVA